MKNLKPLLKPLLTIFSKYISWGSKWIDLCLAMWSLGFIRAGAELGDRLNTCPCKKTWKLKCLQIFAALNAVNSPGRSV